jgi:hypothetical protein
MSEERPGPDERTPFSFRLFVVLAVIYLGWRLIQGIAWVIGKLT